ncbi:hypothetical protein [Spirulina sp. 06S082]|uniref:hypothetical protein n=1 Tax=Spirulina sp. 06S082 TaxID=3110248 RepID=UPI002B21DCEA|nr:hypothetical protein [Spirulina sp. 06S082]MEA5469171.1 hypothetical protein [Spirulina sp. 06S082]
MPIHSSSRLDKPLLGYCTPSRQFAIAGLGTVLNCVDRTIFWSRENFTEVLQQLDCSDLNNTVDYFKTVILARESAIKSGAIASIPRGVENSIKAITARNDQNKDVIYFMS